MGKYHDILGVKPGASQDEIKKAYRKLASELHPDKTQGDEEAENRLKEVNEAYDGLKKGMSGPQSERQRGGFSHGRSNDPFSTIFEEFFGGGGNSWSNRTVQMHQTISVPLETMFKGGTMQVSAQIDPGSSPIILHVPIPENCPLDHKAFLDPSDGLPEGMNVVLSIRPKSDDPTMQMSQVGTIMMQYSVDVFTMMLGGKVKVQHPDGHQYEIEVPEGSDPDTKLRLSGLGLKPSQNHPNGDFLIMLQPKMRKLSDEQKKVLKDNFKTQ